MPNMYTTNTYKFFHIFRELCEHNKYVKKVDTVPLENPMFADNLRKLIQCVQRWRKETFWHTSYSVLQYITSQHIRLHDWIETLQKYG